jgi:hypothetical protein
VKAGGLTKMRVRTPTLSARNGHGALVLALIIGVVTTLPARASDQSCTAFEATNSIQGDIVSFHHDRFPWTITVDLDGNLAIENAQRHTRCTTVLNSVVAAYVGSQRLIYLRTLEIASDELFTLDGFTCWEVRNVKGLDVESESNSIEILRANGVCAGK